MEHLIFQDPQVLLMQVFSTVEEEYFLLILGHFNSTVENFNSIVEVVVIKSQYYYYFKTKFNLMLEFDFVADFNYKNVNSNLFSFNH